MSDYSEHVKSAYDTFIKNAEDSDLSDPIKAIENYFSENATEDLKEKVKAEGKSAADAFEFLYAVAKLCPKRDGGCHIPPAVGFAIVMHYFQDVPKKSAAEVPRSETAPAAKAPRKDPPKKSAAKAPRKKRQPKQEFFFDAMTEETKEAADEA